VRYFSDNCKKNNGAKLFFSGRGLKKIGNLTTVVFKLTVCLFVS